MSALTNEQRAAQVAALIRERDGYVRYGRLERAARVDAELQRLGADGAPPARRATRLKRAGSAKVEG